MRTGAFFPELSSPPPFDAESGFRDLLPYQLEQPGDFPSRLDSPGAKTVVVPALRLPP